MAEGFVNRWSRRKQALMESDPPPPDAEAAGAKPQTEIENAPPPDLPDIESLDANSDYTAFLQDGVPEELQRLALRTLWRSDPVLANLDGLNDYDEDFGAAMRIGAEAMREFARLEAAEAKAAEAEAGEVSPQPDDAEREIAGDDSTVSPDTPGGDEISDASDADEDPVG